MPFSAYALHQILASSKHSTENRACPLPIRSTVIIKIYADLPRSSANSNAVEMEREREKENEQSQYYYPTYFVSATAKWKILIIQALARLSTVRNKALLAGVRRARARIHDARARTLEEY